MRTLYLGGIQDDILINRLAYTLEQQNPHLSFYEINRLVVEAYEAVLKHRLVYIADHRK